MRINVTQRDIDIETRSCCPQSPIVRAANRLKHISGAYLDMESEEIRFTPVPQRAVGPEVHGYALPDVAVAFIHAFDKYERVHPFAFEIH